MLSLMVRSAFLRVSFAASTGPLLAAAEMLKGAATERGVMVTAALGTATDMGRSILSVRKDMVLMCRLYDVFPRVRAVFDDEFDGLGEMRIKSKRGRLECCWCVD